MPVTREPFRSVRLQPEANKVKIPFEIRPSGVILPVATLEYSYATERTLRGFSDTIARPSTDVYTDFTKFKPCLTALVSLA